MKKLLNTAFVYAILGLISGVFYREFTKIYDYNGNTALKSLHPHLFILGMMMFLILTIFNGMYHLTESKKFAPFYIVYNIGLVFTVIMLIIRGIVEVTATNLSSGLDHAISGMAGIGHIILSIGFVIMFLLLKETVCNSENKEV